MSSHITIHLIVKFLQDKRKYRKRQAKISTDISQGHVSPTLRYTNTQKLNCRCQELGPTYITVSVVPIWRIFTPPCEFLPHSEDFTPNPKNVREMIIITNTHNFKGQKFTRPPPPPPPLPTLYPTKYYHSTISEFK